MYQCTVYTSAGLNINPSKQYCSSTGYNTLLYTEKCGAYAVCTVQCTVYTVEGQVKVLGMPATAFWEVLRAYKSRSFCWACWSCSPCWVCWSCSPCWASWSCSPCWACWSCSPCCHNDHVCHSGYVCHSDHGCHSGHNCHYKHNHSTTICLKCLKYLKCAHFVHL